MYMLFSIPGLIKDILCHTWHQISLAKDQGWEMQIVIFIFLQGGLCGHIRVNMHTYHSRPVLFIYSL